LPKQPATKRFFDFVCAGLGVLVLSPFLAAIAIAVKVDSPGPALYRGRRAGLRGEPFLMLKFRTMVMEAEKMGGPSTPIGDARITRIGKYLRKYKLDELPQLFNILRHEMSLVGPRPEVLSEIETYSPAEKELLSVLPGITDWASLHFRNEGEILKGSPNPHQAYREKIRPEKIELGLRYVREHSFLIDIKIIAKTLRAILVLSPSVNNMRKPL
jgi:lipopolysaccharide/colanic/teichoic acid biosynthesis glycosyltransferase